MDVTRPKPSHIKHRTASKSRTLMRHTVSKPKPSLKRKTKVNAEANVSAARPAFRPMAKLSHPSIDTKRQQHAKQVPQSTLISRFGAPAAISPAPTIHHTPKPAMHKSISPIHSLQSSVPTTPSASLDIFERALQRANSHQAPTFKPLKKPRRHKPVGKRIVGIGAGALAVVVLAGFIAFQNQASLTMRYASNKAGFGALLPAYSPDGYKAGKFLYSPGVVGVKFTDKTGDSYNLVQQQTAWDSSSLLNEFVATSSQTYDIIQSAGQTIYTYGDNNATWVDGGVWYRVVSNGSLTSTDIINIAQSI